MTPEGAIGMPAMDKPLAEDFIRAQTVPARPALVPEVELYLATEITPIWKATETWLEAEGVEPPFWAFAWPGSQALARLVLDEPAAQGIARLADTMPTTAPEVEVIEDDDCIILYTSGTTGRPKGALFDHHRMLLVGNSVSALGMNIFDRNLHVAPMYHCAELVLFVMSGFSLGTTHVVLPAFEPKAVLDAL